MTKSIDLYTKIILTVIAVCLTCVVARDIKIVPEARAASSGSVVDVNIVSVAGNDISTRTDVAGYKIMLDALPVKIMSK